MQKKESKVKAGSAGTKPRAADARCRCQVESLVSVDEKGQMVLPKPVRDRAGIKAGDKMGLVTWERDGSICCIALIKASEMAKMAKSMLGPIMKDMV